jgi:hypothetical protein
MQSIQRYEAQVMREIMAFPREKLPQVARLLRLLRQEFAPEGRTKSAHGKSSWETDLVKFRNTVSGTDEFIARKADEKTLER